MEEGVDKKYKGVKQLPDGKYTIRWVYRRRQFTFTRSHDVLNRLTFDCAPQAAFFLDLFRLELKNRGLQCQISLRFPSAGNKRVVDEAAARAAIQAECGDAETVELLVNQCREDVEVLAAFVVDVMKRMEQEEAAAQRKDGQREGGAAAAWRQRVLATQCEGTTVLQCEERHALEDAVTDEAGACTAAREGLGMRRSVSVQAGGVKRTAEAEGGSRACVKRPHCLEGWTGSTPEHSAHTHDAHKCGGIDKGDQFEGRKQSGQGQGQEGNPGRQQGGQEQGQEGNPGRQQGGLGQGQEGNPGTVVASPVAMEAGFSGPDSDSEEDSLELPESVDTMPADADLPDPPGPREVDRRSDSDADSRRLNLQTAEEAAATPQGVPDSGGAEDALHQERVVGMLYLGRQEVEERVEVQRCLKQDCGWEGDLLEGAFVVVRKREGWAMRQIAGCQFAGHDAPLLYLNDGAITTLDDLSTSPGFHSPLSPLSPGPSPLGPHLLPLLQELCCSHGWNLHRSCNEDIMSGIRFRSRSSPHHNATTGEGTK